MKTMIAVMALIAMIGVGIAGAVDVRETSWGIPFLAPDPSLKTTDPFYLGHGATPIGGHAANYRLPPVLTGDDIPTAKRASIFDHDPWMDGPSRSGETVTLSRFSSGDLTDHQIDKMYGGQVPGEIPWM